MAVFLFSINELYKIHLLIVYLLLILIFSDDNIKIIEILLLIFLFNVI